MITVYQILTYNMIGETLKTWQPLINFDSIIEKKYNTNGDLRSILGVINGKKELIESSYVWGISLNQLGFEYAKTPLLPYFADVTEDIPSSYKFEGKTYKNCQLLAEKHGTYLEFYHKPTEKVSLSLTIANSV